VVDSIDSFIRFVAVPPGVLCQGEHKIFIAD
jgi:hypothetical protein